MTKTPVETICGFYAVTAAGEAPEVPGLMIARLWPYPGELLVKEGLL